MKNQSNRILSTFNFINKFVKTRVDSDGRHITNDTMFFRKLGNYLYHLSNETKDLVNLMERETGYDNNTES